METNQIKGLNYEIQIRDYIRTELNKNAYLWDDTPETILINAGIIGSHNEHRLTRKNKINKLQDTGVDIIQIESDNICSLVQCKNGYENGLTYEDLTGFMCWMASLDKLNGFIYYTNKLSNAITSLPPNKRIQYIKQKYNDKKDTTNEIIKIIKPFDYQINAKDEIIKYFKDNYRGILSMPCGTGKTFTSFIISNNYKQIILISPLKQFAKQNLDKYIEYGYNKENTLLVDSDGERDIKEIKKFIKSKKSFVISATFCSVDVINKCLQYTNDPLIIIDEFHNLSKTNIKDEEDDFNKILFSNYRILFMSATPRVYDIEDDDEYESEDIFGQIVYKMTFTEAIEKKYITDYRIWLPSIHEDNERLNKELSIYKIDSVILAKCRFLFSCLLNNGSKKCIIYCQDTTEIKKMIEAFNKLNKYFILDYEINQITSADSEKVRAERLDNFAKSNKIQLLFSVRILDECIDIPSCDSIYITYPTKSKIRTIQRLSRCIRIDKNNQFKIGNIYIWCDEYDKILDTLSGIKEYDLFFNDKIKINETNQYGSNNKEDILNDIKLIEKYILGIKEFKHISWDEKLEWVKKYIDENGKRPLTIDKNLKIKQYGQWISNQNQNYKDKKAIMKNSEIYNKWTEFINDDKYKIHFLSNDEEWFNNLEWVKNYIDNNNKRPSNKNKNLDIKKYGEWISTQNKNYYKKSQIMGENPEIYNKWTEFITKYEDHFISNEEKWSNNLEWVKKYIDNNKEKPSEDNKNPDIKKYGEWISNQQQNYKKKQHLLSQENFPEIYNKWTEFITKYKKYFLSNDEEWFNNLEWVKNYINNNNERPSSKNKNSDIKKYGAWIGTQGKNYKKKEYNMKNENIKKVWEEFITKYQDHFPGNPAIQKVINIKSKKNIEV